MTIGSFHFKDPSDVEVRGAIRRHRHSGSRTTTTNTAVAIAKLTGSVGWTPNKSPPIRRTAVNEARLLAATSSPTSSPACRRTSDTVWAGGAPAPSECRSRASARPRTGSSHLDARHGETEGQNRETDERPGAGARLGDGGPIGGSSFYRRVVRTPAVSSGHACSSLHMLLDFRSHAVDRQFEITRLDQSKTEFSQGNALAFAQRSTCLGDAT